MSPIVLIVLGIVVGGAASIKIHETPGVRAAETVIAPGEEIDDLVGLAQALGLDPSDWSLQIETSRKISNGLTRHKLRLSYGGYAIRVFTLQASTNEEGKFVSAVSGWIPRIRKLDTSVSKEDNKLKAAAARYINSKKPAGYDVDDINPQDIENFEAKKQIHINVRTGRPVVVYYVHGLVDIDDYIRNPKIILNAKNLRVIDGSVIVRKRRNAEVCPKARGGNAKVPGYYYGRCRGEVCLNAHVSGSTCELSSDKIIVKNANNGWNRKNAQTVRFNCSEGLDDFANGAYSPNADAFYYSHAFYGMFLDWADLDVSGDSPLVLYTHYGEDFANSFYDGYSVTFGDGNINTYPFTIPELVAHEMCHGVTASLGNLNFYGESLAIDEGFADICGIGLSYYLKPCNDWSYGFDLLKDPNAALRYFDAPSKQSYIIDNYGDAANAEYSTQLRGILHKFFYSVVEEENVPIRDAFEALVHANVIYFQDETGFIDGACAILRSASDLGLDTDAFRSAFETVGINLDFCNVNGTVDFIKAPRQRRGVTVSSSKHPSYVVETSSGVDVDVSGSDADVSVSVVDYNGDVVASGLNRVHSDATGWVRVVLGGQGRRDRSIDVSISLQAPAGEISQGEDSTPSSI